jgi:fructose-1,6-bisphosphatase/inositol monophosphatase family enzyme
MTLTIPNRDIMSQDMIIDYIILTAIAKATEVILQEVDNEHFEVEVKESKSKEYDEVTSADYAAQETIISIISNLMPEAGMVGEEKNFNKPTQNGYTFFFDPIDGTKEFVRKGNEVSIMIACMYEGKIIAASIHNPFTSERYTLMAKTGKVYRHRAAGADFRTYVGEEQNFNRHPRNNPILSLDDMRSEVLGYTGFMSEPNVGFFNPHLISTGSFGTNLMRLASSQVCAVIIKACTIYPWDALPVYGILIAMGFKGYLYCPSDEIPWHKQDLRLDSQEYQQGILLITQPKIFDDFYSHTYK